MANYGEKSKISLILYINEIPLTDPKTVRLIDLKFGTLVYPGH